MRRSHFHRHTCSTVEVHARKSAELTASYCRNMLSRWGETKNLLLKLQFRKLYAIIFIIFKF